MTDVETLQKFWKEQYTKPIPSFKDFTRTIKVYKPKYKWQSYLPFIMLKWFVKPSTLYSCFPKSIDNLVDDSGNFQINVSMNYKNDL